MSKNDEYDIIIIKLKKVEEYIIIWNQMIIYLIIIQKKDIIMNPYIYFIILIE